MLRAEQQGADFHRSRRQLGKSGCLAGVEQIPDGAVAQAGERCGFREKNVALRREHLEVSYCLLPLKPVGWQGLVARLRRMQSSGGVDGRSTVTCSHEVVLNHLLQETMDGEVVVLDVAEAVRDQSRDCLVTRVPATRHPAIDNLIIESLRRQHRVVVGVGEDVEKLERDGVRV